MTFGGGRSTKTFRNVRLIAARATLAPNSRHLIVRRHLRTVRAAVMRDTLPKVMRLCFPNTTYKLNKTEGVAVLDNGSEIWMLGLDDDSRVEKILGMEFASIFVNECSEIGWNSIELVLTRLAQNINLKVLNRGKPQSLTLMALYDCNPPKKSHWSYQVFFQKKDPKTKKPLPNPSDYSAFQMNPADNPLLPEQTRKLYQNMSAEKRKRFWDGEFGEDVEGALWNWAHFKPFPDRQLIPDFRRIVVAVDPPATGGTAGIVVAGLGIDGNGYVLADRSCSGRPEEWARAAVHAYKTFGADCIVAEINQGGDMVRSVVHAIDKNVPYKAVRATRGKVVRAEPVTALYGEGRIYHAPRLDALENQMCEFTSSFDVTIMGYSPDRVDALVWALTELMLNSEGQMGTMGISGT